MSEPTKGPWELQEYPGERFAEVWSRSQEKAIAKVWFGGYLDDSLNRLCVEEEAANAELIVNALNWKSRAEKAEAKNAKLQARVQELEGRWSSSYLAQAQKRIATLEAQLKQAELTLQAIDENVNPQDWEIFRERERELRAAMDQAKQEQP